MSVNLNKINDPAGIPGEGEMIMSDKLIAALLHAEADAEEMRGFGPTAEDAMRDAVQSGRVTWQTEEPATWAEITCDALKAGMLRFTQTPYGVLVTDMG